jgi:hypothetical protein
MNLKEIFLPYCIVWLGMLFLVISYLLEHFKLNRLLQPKKVLVVHFLKNNLYLKKIFALRSKVMKFLR